MEGSRTTTITPLNELNYPTWKIHVKLTLMRDKLWKYISEPDAEPPDSSDADTRRKYNERLDCCLAVIVLFFYPSLLYLVGDPTNPVVCRSMDKIQRNFSKKDMGKQAQVAP